MNQEKIFFFTSTCKIGCSPQALFLAKRYKTQKFDNRTIKIQYTIKAPVVNFCMMIFFKFK
jgi:hypothetical protein